MEQLCDFRGLPPQDLAQDQRCALARREVLEGRYEREADRVLGDGGVGGVGQWFEPGRFGFGVEVLFYWCLRRAQVHRARAALRALQHVQADIGGDAVEPRAQGRALFEAVERAPSAHEGFLDRILGVERRAEHPVAVRGQLGPMLLELAEVRRGRCRGLVHRQGCYASLRHRRHVP